MNHWWGMIIILCVTNSGCKKAIEFDSSNVSSVLLELRYMQSDSLIKVQLELTNQDSIKQFFDLLISKSEKITPGTTIEHSSGRMILRAIDRNGEPVFCGDYNFFSEYGSYFMWFDCDGAFRAFYGSFINDQAAQFLLSICTNNGIALPPELISP